MHSGFWHRCHFLAMSAQLENLCNWLTVMAPAQTVEQKDLPPDLTPTQEYAGESTALTASVTEMGGGSHGTMPGGAGGLPVSPLGAPLAGVPPSVWENGLRTEVARLLRENTADVMDELARRFEAAVIREALDFTRGRKVEAAERLGIGRNTITRKIQELHLDA